MGPNWSRYGSLDPARITVRFPRCLATATAFFGTDIATGSYYLTTTRFHAAVGLAQLGESDGLEWLIVNCEDTSGSVMNAQPKGAPPGGGLGACCTESLRQLSGERARTSKLECRAWLTTADKKRYPNMP